MRDLKPQLPRVKFRFSEGFCAPIIWGAIHCYSVSEIAEGLGLLDHVVIEVIEAHSEVRFPRVLAAPADIDPFRSDDRYLNWRRQRHGAQQTRQQLEAMEA